jgi:hypothetical protein
MLEIMDIIVILALIPFGPIMYFVGKRQGRAEVEEEMRKSCESVDVESVLPVLNDLMGVVVHMAKEGDDD